MFHRGPHAGRQVSGYECNYQYDQGILTVFRGTDSAAAAKPSVTMADVIFMVTGREERQKETKRSALLRSHCYFPSLVLWALQYPSIPVLRNAPSSPPFLQQREGM